MCTDSIHPNGNASVKLGTSEWNSAEKCQPERLGSLQYSGNKLRDYLRKHGEEVKRILGISDILGSRQTKEQRRYYKRLKKKGQEKENKKKMKPQKSFKEK